MKAYGKVCTKMRNTRALFSIETVVIRRSLLVYFQFDQRRWIGHSRTPLFKTSGWQMLNCMPITITTYWQISLFLPNSMLLFAHFNIKMHSNLGSYQDKTYPTPIEPIDKILSRWTVPKGKIVRSFLSNTRFRCLNAIFVLMLVSGAKWETSIFVETHFLFVNSRHSFTLVTIPKHPTVICNRATALNDRLALCDSRVNLRYILMAIILYWVIVTSEQKTGFSFHRYSAKVLP